MAEGDFVSMQEESLTPAVPVKVVAQYGHPQPFLVGAVHSQLVGSAGMGVHFYAGDAILY